MTFLNRKNPMITLLVFIVYISIAYIANHIGWFQLRDISLLWVVIGAFGIMYSVYAGEFEWNSLQELFKQILLFLIIGSIGKFFENIGVSYILSFGLGLAGGVVLMMGYHMNISKKQKQLNISK